MLIYTIIHTHIDVENEHNNAWLTLGRSIFKKDYREEFTNDIVTYT
jgi:hypothetical protein